MQDLIGCINVDKVFIYLDGYLTVLCQINAKLGGGITKPENIEYKFQIFLSNDNTND